MDDVQDILEISNAAGQQDQILTKESLLGDSKKNVKRPVQRVSRKPEGMSREVYNLFVNDKHDIPPLVPTVTSKMGGYKNVKAKLGLRKVRPWRWTSFSNQGRKDSLKLSHWHRVEDDDQEYPFAKFNKVLDLNIPTSDDFKTLSLVNEDWSQEEMEHLFDLCARFDLRWPIIHDRFDSGKFGKPRSMEDLKEKFYNTSNKIVQSKTPEGQLLYFDAEHERHRKDQLEKLWNRTDEQVEEEAFLAEELQRIETRKKERTRKAKDLQKLISAVDRSPSSATLSQMGGGGAGGSNATMFGMGGTFSSLGSAPRKKFLKSSGSSSLPLDSLNIDGATAVKFPEFKTAGVHARSQQMRLPNTLGQKKLKAVEVALQKMGLEAHPPATPEIVAQFNDLRSDIMLLYELKSALSSCEFELESLKHQYQGLTNQELNIPAHLRVTHEPNLEAPETSSPFKRRISDALEVPIGPIVSAGVQRKKKTMSFDATVSIRKFRKT